MTRTLITSNGSCIIASWRLWKSFVKRRFLLTFSYSARAFSRFCWMDSQTFSEITEPPRRLLRTGAALLNRTDDRFVPLDIMRALGGKEIPYPVFLAMLPVVVFRY